MTTPTRRTMLTAAAWTAPAIAYAATAPAYATSEQPPKHKCRRECDPKARRKKHGKKRWQYVITTSCPDVIDMRGVEVSVNRRPSGSWSGIGGKKHGVLTLQLIQRDRTVRVAQVVCR